MRRGTMLVLGLLMAATAMPPSAADARPLITKVLRGITAPFGAILGGGQHAGRRAVHHRRAVASRSAVASRARPAARIAAPAAAAGGATTAAVAATASPDTANAQAAAPATTGLARTPDATIQDTRAVPLPAPAPSQRNAALAVAEDEPQACASALGPAPPADQASPPARAQSRLGRVGPPAWPTAYEDVVGFTLWPKEYGERLRVHGIGDLLSTAFATSASVAARTEPNKTRQARADGNAPVTNAQVAISCGSVDLTSADWPIAEITSAMELTDAQRATLDQFKTALSDAVSSIKSTCRDDTNLAPVERVRLMQNALWAVHDAAQLIRKPLTKFYDSLTEEQKQKFAAPAPIQAGGRTLNRSDMARMCDLPSADAAMRQIEQSLRPTKAQRASLEVLQKKAFEMGQFLMASCLKPMPATPAERLDAAADRLTAVIFAASNVNMALNDFTSQLSDEQKTKLNSLVR
jgi:LTXXQ motif family protein